MRIRPGTVTVAVMAILFGLVAAYTARRYMEAPAAPAPRTVGIVTAKVNLPTYARIREQDLELVQVAPNQVPQGAITSIQRALHRVVKDTTLSGDMLTDGALYPVGQMPTLAEQVPAGCRAVTFTVDRNNALAGVLMPNAIIDIAMTVKGTHPDLHGVTTVTLLKGAKVLATSQHLFKTEEKINQSLRSVTVAVTPEDANKLILAQKFGTLSVTLCGAGPDTIVAQNEEKIDNDAINPLTLLGIKAIEPPKPVAVTKAQIWRGSSMSEITFQGNQLVEEKEKTASAHPAEPVPATQVPTAIPTAYGRESSDYNPYRLPEKDKVAVPPLGTSAQR